MGNSQPNAEIAIKVLPSGLRKAILHIFDQNITGVTLVGGTALAGFYAGHRQSDDIDLFVLNEDSHRAAIYAVESLVQIGAICDKILVKSNQFYRSIYILDGHTFSIDVVMDPGFYGVAQFTSCGSIKIASLVDLLSMKIATLVSRCSEKDLYDLRWLFEKFKGKTLEEKIELGSKIDGGVSLDSLILAVGSATLKADACGFCELFNKSKEDVYRDVVTFKDSLLKELIALSEITPLNPELSGLIALFKGPLR